MACAPLSCLGPGPAAERVPELLSIYEQRLLQRWRDGDRKAGIVLGWVGTAGDMKTVLRDRLLHDPSAFVRGNAATAFRQVWYRIPGAKESAIEILGEALSGEEDEDAIAGIVVSLQTIMKRRFGLREPDDGPSYVGDVARAKVRAMRAVAR
jgi:hypothetical protein